MDSKLLDKILRQACQAEIKEDLKIMRKYTDNWKPEDKPKWSIRSKRVAMGFETRMSTSSQPFVWVEAGTDKRMRALSPGWQSKTRPHTLETRMGRGKALGLLSRPAPGIKARENLETMAKIRRPIFAKKVQADLNRAALGLFK